ncbi:asparagine synthase (glutamine-hydrolyzing) [Clostridium bornimense]|uniref:asparagine synthase (glutamine-hydrolyzing) n=1 Tax=Clostridium bornimense TaxID=1216932 RepID=UPI001C0FB6E4|nr:asparagine synthase (glutamine-hydrolyzing) [Clostridium bornimense]MBU5316094.1 asparagine synthase (glutamine-hydrolyzing) [Clostridium bornimense]
MCGIAGVVNYRENLNSSSNIKTIEDMTKTLEKRGPDSSGIYIDTHCTLGHRRLIVVDPEGGLQPMTKKTSTNEYTIVYNGEIYNTENVRSELIKEGYSFDSYSDTEVLLTSYIHWGVDCLSHINGIFAFAIWDKLNESLFLVRDPLGVKPLFYTKKGNSFIFGSEIKTLLANNKVNRVLDKEGILELFALGPATALGSGVLKGIKEIPPANYIIISKDKEELKEYWKVTPEPFTESLDEATIHLQSLLIDAINRQLVGDVPVCTFLSGGLDSSAISAIAAKTFRENGKTLTTYSIDYKDNDKYFKSSLYQPTSDQFWALKVSKDIGSNHVTVVNDNIELAEALIPSVIARDLPGMADVDSSLYLFCKEIRKNFVVGLSGECADELFGGYPWFTRSELINYPTFPWSRFVDDRKTLLSDDLQSLDLDGFAYYHYKKTLMETPHLDDESPMDYRMRELFYLNIKWFMVNLLNRKDRMSMSNSFEARVPFADYRLVQYAFNLPYEIKFADGREKGLLRRALKGILADDVIYRKKSPYPKTYHPDYTNKVCSMLSEIMDNPNSPILEIINKKKIHEIIDSKGSSYKTPWFGQLMTGPQLIAYLVGLNAWLDYYNIDIIK